MTKMVFIAHHCLSCCTTVLTQIQGLLWFSCCLAMQGGWRCPRSWLGGGGSQPVQLTQPGKRDLMFHGITLSNNSCRKEGGRGGCFKWLVISPTFLQVAEHLSVSQWEVLNEILVLLCLCMWYLLYLVTCPSMYV